MLDTHCPKQNRISEYLRGLLPDEESGTIAEHLEHCSQCDSVASGLEQSRQDSDWLMKHLGRTDAVFPDDETPAERLPSDVSDDQLLTIGNYRIEQIVGRGGMGIVCRATHEKLNKTVALKIISSPHLVDARNRFEREMRAIGGLQHESIVQATDAGSIDGRPFLAMQFIEGIDLAAILKTQGPFSIEAACEIARQTAVGLQFAHEQNIIHRDIKPSNIMLDADGSVKILDFGLAQVQSASSTVTMATSVGQLLGTLDYLAPEQTDGSTVDARADVYSLAATLYTLLAGRPPLGGSSDKPVLQHLRKLVSEKPRPLDEFREDAPLELTNLLQRALEPEPDRRNLSARQFADSLQRHCENASLREIVPAPASRTEESAAAQRTEAILCLRKLHDSTLLASETTQTQAVSKSVSKTRPATSGYGRFIKYATGLLIALALLGGGGLLGIAIYLETGEGQLKIESDAEDIRVTLLKDEDIVDEIEVSRGEKEITVRAGKYKVRVESASDEVTISQETVRVTRGDQIVLVVTKVPAAEQPALATAQPAPAARPADSSLEARLAAIKTPPLWQNKRPEECLVIIRQERDEETRAEAIRGATAVSKGLPPDVAAELLLECGTATLEAYVNQDPNRVPGVLITSQELWNHETSLGYGQLHTYLDNHLKKQWPFLSQHTPRVASALRQLPIDTQRSLIEPTLNGDNVGAKAMLLRVLLVNALSSDEPDQLTADLLLPHCGGRDKMASITRAIAAVLMRNDRGAAMLTKEMESRPENSLHPALLLRLANKFYADEIPDEVRLNLLAHTCSHFEGRAVMRIYETRQLWPPANGTADHGNSKASDAFATVLLPKLAEKAKLEDFGARFIDPAIDPQLFHQFQLLVQTLLENGASPETSDRTTALLDQVLPKIREARDRVQLNLETIPDRRWDDLENAGTNFRDAIELYVCLNGRLPAVITEPPSAEAYTAGWLRRYETQLANARPHKGDDPVGEWAANWFPHHSVRTVLQGMKKSGITDTPEFLRDILTRTRHQPATAFASVLEIQGNGEIEDEILLQLLSAPPERSSPFEIKSRRQTIRLPMDICNSRIFGEYALAIRRHPKLAELAMRMFDDAKNDRLKACGLAVLFTNSRDSLAETVSKYSLADPLFSLIQSDDDVASLYAVLWADHAGLFKGSMRNEQVVERLSRDGFLLTDDPSMFDTFIGQRLHFLSKLDDANLEFCAEAMLEDLASTDSEFFIATEVHFLVDPDGELEQDCAIVKLAEITARSSRNANEYREKLESLNNTAAMQKKMNRHLKQRFSDTIAKLLEQKE